MNSTNDSELVPKKSTNPNGKDSTMTPDDLYIQCDQMLLPSLETSGFAKKQLGEYCRQSENGWDRIMISHGPDTKKNTHFAVFLSYYWECLETTLDDIISCEGEDRGFACGPYLTPVSVTSRPKYWGYRTKEALQKSLNHVAECLQTVGLPWLESLRDPKVYADNVDPVAALPAGLAHEMAGNIEKARASYQEMYRRYCGMIDEFGEKMVLERDGKAFIFVSAKLDVDHRRREAFENLLDYHPEIEPL